jgi:hypothetical protein
VVKKVETKKLTSEFESKLKKLFESNPFGGEKLKGGLGDNRDVEEFNPVQVVKGIKVEMEHTNDVKSVLEIVVDHLTEDPLYYDHLEKIDPQH